MHIQGCQEELGELSNAIASSCQCRAYVARLCRSICSLKGKACDLVGPNSSAVSN